MDWNLFLCFVLIKNNFLNPFQNVANQKNQLRNYGIDKYMYKQDTEPIYAIVDMDIVIGRPYGPSTKKPPTYHGNEKWGMSRKNKDRLFKSNQGRSSLGRKLKPTKGTVVSYEEMSSKYHDAIDSQANKKHNPGNRLIQSNGHNLESDGKFPVTEKSSLVYGNLENLGNTYGETNQRLEYSDFRKSRNLMNLFDDIPRSKPNSGPKKWIVLEILPLKMRNLTPETNEVKENNANEIVDESSEGDKEDYRRKKSKSKFRKREKYNSDWKSSESEESNSATSESSSKSRSSNEKNDGNPFSLHKGKYKQNWMWNHNMDGDHMNINPYGPLFHDMAATGQDLFLGRKWWYFNQDDYKPMG